MRHGIPAIKKFVNCKYGIYKSLLYLLQQWVLLCTKKATERDCRLPGLGAWKSKCHECPLWGDYLSPCPALRIALLAGQFLLSPVLQEHLMWSNYIQLNVRFSILWLCLKLVLTIKAEVDLYTKARSTIKFFQANTLRKEQQTFVRKLALSRFFPLFYSPFSKWFYSPTTLGSFESNWFWIVQQWIISLLPF